MHLHQTPAVTQHSPRITHAALAELLQPHSPRCETTNIWMIGELDKHPLKQWEKQQQHKL